MTRGRHAYRDSDGTVPEQARRSAALPQPTFNQRSAALPQPTFNQRSAALPQPTFNQFRIICDRELVDAMLRSEPRAWREFQARYDRLIHRCITKVTRRFPTMVSGDDVYEIQAQLFLSLLANEMHKLRTFDPERGNRFSSWLGLLAIHCAYDHLRTLRREPTKTSLTEATEIAGQIPDPFECVAERQRAALTADMLDGFSDKDRTFATLYFDEELEPNEIAARMNISVKTVYSKKHKIQSRLESVLSGQIEHAA